MEGIAEHIEKVIDAAQSAPSHQNAQPWRFTVDGDTISFAIDHERDPSPDGTMARIAIGAALECAAISAARMGATLRFQEPREGALVTVSVEGPKRIPEPDLQRMRRVTNRRPYDGRALDDTLLVKLRDAVPQRDLAQVHWFGRTHVRALGPIFEQAEELYHLDANLRDRAINAIRFDVKDRESVDRGIAIGSLELQAAERAALLAIRKPATSSVNVSSIKVLAARARKLIESASGVLIITTPSTEPMSDVDVGRTVQRAWMAVTKEGLAAHPMTRLIALSLAPSSLGTENDLVPPLMQSFRKVFPMIPDATRIAFLMRFGWAEAPSCRTGRLPMSESIATLDINAPAAR
jgi:hypothetical protein